MDSYIEDVLAKYNCSGCGGDFILSEYQTSNADKKIVCPYCSCGEIKKIIKYDPSERTIDISGCIAIGHYSDIEKELENYEYTWGRIVEAKIDNFLTQTNEEYC